LANKLREEEKDVPFLLLTYNARGGNAKASRKNYNDSVKEPRKKNGNSAQNGGTPMHDKRKIGFLLIRSPQGREDPI